MQNHIFCIYHDIGRADEVVDQLLSADIGRKHISILTTKATGARQLASSQGSRPPKGGVGASMGAAVGLLCETLITAATAGVGVLAVGPVLTCLIGSSAGATTGSLFSILAGAGIPEAEAEFYAQEIAEKDAILIGVEVTDSDRNMVRQILSKRPLGIEAEA